MNGLSSAEWRSDTHPADRINELEARVKELEAVLDVVLDHFDIGSDDSRVAFKQGMAALKKEKP
jgi:hypothetical protein